MENIAKMRLCTQEKAVPRDFWGAWLFTFVVASMTLSNIPGASIATVLYGIMLSFLFALYFLFHKLEVQPESIIFMSWVIWSAAGSANAVDQGLFLQGFITAMQIAVMIFVTSGITAQRMNMSSIMLAIITGAVLVAASVLLTGQIGHLQDSQEGVRVSGMLGNANDFAYHLLFAVMACFYILRNKRSAWWRIPILGVLGVLAICIVYSGSRRVFATAVIFFFLVWLFCKEKKLSDKPLKLYAIVVLLLFAVCYSASYVMSRTYLGERLTQMDNSGNQRRIELYKEGMQMISKHPVTGVGLKNFTRLSSSGLYSHSDYVEVAADTGLVGFVIYFSVYPVLWLRLRRIKRLINHPDILFAVGFLKAAILTILLNGFGRGNTNSKLTWIFLACATGYSWSVERKILRLKKDRPASVRNREAGLPNPLRSGKT